MSKKITYEEAKLLVRELKRRARFTIAGKRARLRIIAAGSFRRKKQLMKDIDFMIIMPAKYNRYKDEILDSFELKAEGKKSEMKNIIANMSVSKKTILPGRSVSLASGPVHHAYKVNLVSDPASSYLIFDFYLVPERVEPFALLHYTGDSAFNIRVRAHVKALGMKLNQYGLFDSKTGKPIKTNIKNERDIFKYIGVTYKSPSQRTEKK